MTKELAREVSGFYLSSPCEVWWIAESVLNMSRSRADGTMSFWLLYFRNFTNFHTVSYILWTPLWTKCASAAAILSNISADGLEGSHTTLLKSRCCKDQYPRVIRRVISTSCTGLGYKIFAEKILPKLNRLVWQTWHILAHQCSLQKS